MNRYSDDFISSFSFIIHTKSSSSNAASLCSNDSPLLKLLSLKTCFPFQSLNSFKASLAVWIKRCCNRHQQMSMFGLENFHSRFSPNTVVRTPLRGSLYLPGITRCSVHLWSCYQQLRLEWEDEAYIIPHCYRSNCPFPAHIVVIRRMQVLDEKVQKLVCRTSAMAHSRNRITKFT